MNAPSMRGALRNITGLTNRRSDAALLDPPETARRPGRLSLPGRDSAQTVETRAFAAALQGAVAVPVELYDERFTTRLAARTGGRASEDSRAAAHLLESWLAAHPEHGGER